MQTTDSSTAKTTRLATYRAHGEERELHAVQVPDENIVHVIDVLARPRVEDGDLDQRHVEDQLTDLQQAQAIAADYAELGHRIGRCPMDGIWW